MKRLDRQPFVVFPFFLVYDIQLRKFFVKKD